MKIKIKIPLSCLITTICTITAILVFVSCKSFLKETGPPPYKPEVMIYINNDKFVISVLYTVLDARDSMKIEFIKSIKNIYVNFYNTEKKLTRTEIKPVIVNQSNSKRINMIMLARGEANIFDKYSFETIFIDLNIVTKDGDYNYYKNSKDLSQDIIFSGMKNMELVPFYEKVDTTYLFGVIAKRLEITSKEYLPNSEDFRTEVLTKKNSVQWSSNYKKDYLMSIQKVKPIKIGDYFIYTMNWDKRKNQGGSVSPGSYNLRLTIPSFPDYYTVIMDFPISKN